MLGLCLALSACTGGEDATAADSGSAAPAPGAAASPAAATGDATPAPSASPSPAAKPPAELPRGGRTIFPKHLVVMHYGTAGSGSLGVLGEGTPTQAAAGLEKVAKTWAPVSGRPVLPAFELITTVAQGSPGKDGDYSEPLADADVQRYLDAARKAKMLVVLDIQPGRAEFLAQVKKYEKFLLQPEVGIALDPEWKLTPTQRPLQQIGKSSAAKVNEVSAYLAKLVADNDLPEKIFIVHQFKANQFKDRPKIVDRPGLATVLHVDGFGTQGQKFDTYGVLASRNKQFVNGFKLFLDEDTDLLTPRETMAIRPRPELISYQ